MAQRREDMTRPIDLSDVERGLEVWDKKVASSGWPKDLHNSMYSRFEIEDPNTAFSMTWWLTSIAPRIVSWKAYRGRTMDEINSCVEELLEEMRNTYVRETMPLLNVPFGELSWSMLQRLPMVVSRAKLDQHGQPQKSPVFRSKVCHWIAPRLYPVADNDVLGLNGTHPFELYWKAVHAHWRQIESSEQAKMIERVRQRVLEVQQGGIPRIWDHYPFEVKIVELGLIGRRN